MPLTWLGEVSGGQRVVGEVVTHPVAEDGQVEARMRHQLDPATLRERADYVVDNSGTLDALRAQVDALYADLVGGP